MHIQILNTYIKIALRNISRHRLFTIINVTGLALSMTVGMLVIAMIHDLMQFDRFHSNGDRIYRVISNVYDPARPMDEKATAPLPLGDRLKSHSSVEHVVRIRKSLTDEVVQNNSALPLQGYFADPSFVEVFSFPLASGDSKTALNEPFSLVITKNTAQKLFQTEPHRFVKKRIKIFT